MSFEENLQFYRRKRKITQEQMAEELGDPGRRFQSGRQEFPVVKDTTLNITNPRLYSISYNKMKGQH